MAILGHTTLSEAERYIEEADQIGLAERAVIKLEQRKTNSSPPNHFFEFGKNIKKRKEIKMESWRLALPRGLLQLWKINNLRGSGTGMLCTLSLGLFL